MITDFLALHGGTLGAVIYLLTLALEAFLGKQKPLGAPSILKLLWVLPNYVYTFFRKGALPMSVQKQEALVAKETNEVVLLVLNVARDLKAGVKTAELAGKELGSAMTAIQDSDQILVEMRADPIAWYRTVFAGFGELIAILVGTPGK